MWMTIAVSDDLEQFIEANRGEASPEQYALLLVERGWAAVVEDLSHEGLGKLAMSHWRRRIRSATGSCQT